MIGRNINQSKTDMSTKKDVVEEKCQIGLFGDTAIGKTSLIVQFLQNKFLEEHDPTMEDFFNTSRYFGKQDKVKTSMAILDTAGYIFIF
jgi:GTPase SAR1 family protein